jgi:hypothetical protein
MSFNSDNEIMDQSLLTEQLAAELVNGQSKSIHPMRVCIAIAGGGSNSASAIASIPGASSLLLESIVAYDRRSFAEFVSQNINMEGQEPAENGWLSELESMDSDENGKSGSGNSFHFCSAQSAILLSRSALHRSLKLSPSFQDRCLNCVGVGSASTLVGLPSSNSEVNERRRKRKSRAYVACSTVREGTMVWELELDSDYHVDEEVQMQNRRTRSQEEAAVANLILMAMLRRREISDKHVDTRYESVISKILTREGDAMNEKWFGSIGNITAAPTQSPADGARRIINGESDIAVVLPVIGSDSSELVGQRAQSKLRMETLYADIQIPFFSDVLIIPGSFNPPHIGHAQLANAAVLALRRIRQLESSSTHSIRSMPSSLSSSSSIIDNIWSTVETSNDQYDPTVLFEISVTNVDKPPIDPDEVERRLNLFLRLESTDLPKDWGVILTNAPLFSQKAVVLNNVIRDSRARRKMTFVIGTDTMVRIINPKYYGNSNTNMVAALEDMKEKGVHFIVGGRLEQGTQDE